MRRKYTIAIIAVLGVFALFSFAAVIMQTAEKSSVQQTSADTLYTYVNGLQPDAALTYRIVYKPEHNGIKAIPGSPAFIEETVRADDRGVVRLPAMKPYYNSMALRTNSGSQPVGLKIANQNDNGRLHISGDGFERFSEIILQDGERSTALKTDWAGLFVESVPSNFDGSSAENPIKLAFSGFSLSDAPSNPVFLEVVIAQGGGPTSADVNVYNPRIHEDNCGASSPSVDGESVFRPSTCNSSRMNSAIRQIPENFVAPMMMMANQLSAVMMQQMQIIGSFFDAKEQLEAQRDFQQLVAQAHKDYHPSEQMCQIGSYVRSISQTQQAGNLSKMALNKAMTNYFSQTENSLTAEGADADIRSRFQKFRSTYCDPNELGGSLWELCRSRTYNPASTTSSGTPDERDRFNKDINYFMTLDRPLTLMTDFRDETATPDEEDVIALAKNLYWPVAHNYPNNEVFAAGFNSNYHLYLATRNIMSKYSVAQNSFAAIVGMKSSMPDNLGDLSGPAHMKAFMRDFFELSDEDINGMMGEASSYYAQMEFLTKKLYQHPTFYTSLYDKPANVDRINVSLEAFQLMQGRDQFESMLRQEMLISLLVEQEIMKEVRDVNGVLYELGNQAKRTDPSGF